jgi:hypothetical protein
MRRAFILATITCILFAVTVARENSFTSSSQDGDQTESKVPDPKGLERTAPEATVPETTVPEDVKKSEEGTVETTVVVQEVPKEPAQGGKKYGKPRVVGKPPGKSGPDTSRPDDAGVKRFEGNPDKVTISVGAPAKPAHLRHGDGLGAC